VYNLHLQGLDLLSSLFPEYLYKSGSPLALCILTPAQQQGSADTIPTTVERLMALLDAEEENI
jgi:hypothetical protein